MVGRHPLMLEVYRRVRKVAPTTLSVFIVGETGTGKELVARALHALSGRRGPFVDVNCAAVPETLAEREFFGAERGAFTGADRRSIGLLEQADGGTLFLDEVCSMPQGVQTTLLRAIEQQVVRRVGGRQRLRIDVRLVAAASDPAATLVLDRRLRQDLAYRLAGLEVALPPLRARAGDVRLLIRHFLHEGNGVRRWTLEADARRLLERHAWPGNVRELRTVIQRIKVLVDGTAVRGEDVLNALDHGPSSRAEREGLIAVLEEVGWSVRSAARRLGVPRSTMRYRLKKLGITPPVRR